MEELGQEAVNTVDSVKVRVGAKDFSPEEQRDFTARKPILWESEDATDAEVNEKEVEFIIELKSNVPEIGCNRWPKNTA